jgi:SPX domain protein involved in polyphosphate accumulation
MNKIISDRHEIKYYINFAEYYSITSRLSNIFARDHNSLRDGDYIVRSLYFDNKSNKNYFQKIGGLETRKKIRIRIYNYDSNPVKMEIKNKYNNLIKKETFIIKHTDIERIISGDYAVLFRQEYYTRKLVDGGAPLKRAGKA